MNSHIAIPTTDINKSKAFYKELGFESIGNWRREEKGIAAEVLTNQSGLGIELVKHSSTIKFENNNIYTLHFALEVKDIDNIIKKLKKFDTEIIIPISNGITVKRFIFVADPSGFPVELFENN